MKRSPVRRTWRASPFALAVALAGAVLLAYAAAGSAGFLNLDDDAYVEFAPMVNRGLRMPAVVWAFTAIHSNNWHPLTSLSHMLDCSLFGVRPGPMHWENVGWHLLNTLLVFAVWRRTTRAVWPSAFIAGLFALHPLHVESVAWIAERKDVLSTFWWLLGLLAYVAWTERRTTVRYAGVLACLLLGLLSKPMVVTFPFTLLLLDLWPLQRLGRERLWPLVREKLPLFAAVAAHAVVTFLVQRASGAAAYAARIPLDARIENAFVSYVRYMGKTLWPDSLAPLYFHPGHWPVAVITLTAGLVVAITAVAWVQRHRRPWIAFGWLWFAGTLIPVIGIVQVGAQAMADRYMYVPLLGLATIVAFAGAELVGRFPNLTRPAAMAALAALLCLGLATSRQVRAWHDNFALYEHSLRVGEDNAGVRYLYGTALLAAGRESDAAAQYRRALELQPDYINAKTQLAAIAFRHQDFATTQRLVAENLQHEPTNAALHVNAGIVCRYLNDPVGARKAFDEALRLDPANSDARRQLAEMALAEGRPADAIALLEAVAERNRWDPATLAQLGVLLAQNGRLADAERLLARALWLAPEDQTTRNNLATVRQLLAQPAVKH